jgi:hypothetical protein
MSRRIAVKSAIPSTGSVPKLSLEDAPARFSVAKEGSLPAASRFRYLYLAYLSQSTSERVLYRAIRRHRPRTIIELGLASLRRAERLVSVAQRFRPGDTVQYTGIDLFEGATTHTSASRPPISLKEAFCALRGTEARIRLEPGDPYTALSRAANSLTETDLLIVSGGHDPDDLAKAWFFVPRMLHANSLVMLEAGPSAAGAAPFRILSPIEVSQLSRPSREGRRRAA